MGEIEEVYRKSLRQLKRPSRSPEEIEEANKDLIAAVFGK